MVQIKMLKLKQCPALQCLCSIGLGCPMFTSLGDRCLVLGLGEGIGALPANVPWLTLGERLSCSSAWTWNFVGYSLTQPILGPTPVVHLLDIGLFSSTEPSTLLLPLLLALAESLPSTLPSKGSSSSLAGWEGGTSSSVESFCSRQNGSRNFQQIDA